jgi:hypothetical protein
MATRQKGTAERVGLLTRRLRGATVARLTPDQKVACSNHVGVTFRFIFVQIAIASNAVGATFSC